VLLVVFDFDFCESLLFVSREHFEVLLILKPSLVAVKVV